MSGRVRVAGLLGPPAARLLAASWRFRELDERGAAGPPVTRLQPAVYALWHAHLLPLALLQRDRGAAILVSLHRDGELLARVLRRLGFVPVRGSSTRGGAEGLEEMIALGRAGRPLGLTPDGPRGPARICKPGVVRAAAATGLPIIPAAAAAALAWRLSTWDRFLLPAPGARVVVSYGEPLAVPPGIEGEPLAAWQEEVARRIDREAGRCERAVGGGG